MEIRTDVLYLLQKLNTELPLHTPSRESFIYNEIRSYIDTFSEEYCYVLLDVNLPNGQTMFTPTDLNVTFLINTLPRLCLHPRFDIIKKILLPKKTFCCYKRL